MKSNLTGNFELMREMNTAIILKTIWKNSPISRSGIVEETELTGATVSRIVSKLIEHDLVTEAGYGESQGGRKPIMLTINPGAVLVIGIDIELDEIIGVVVDLNGRVIHHRQTPLEDMGQEAVMELVKEVITGLITDSQQKDKLFGIGVGVHGLVDYNRGVLVYPPGFDWEPDLPISEIIGREFEIPVLLENNDRALAIGERWFGAASNIDNFICIKVGSGIGSGIYTNGDIYRGQSNSAGEIGHITVEDNGELCTCGDYGCLETVASIPSIIKKVQKLIKQGADSRIVDMVSGDIGLINIDLIFEAANSSDLLCSQVLAEVGRYLGISIANTVNLLNPEAVILGGKIVEAQGMVLDSLRQTLRSKALDHPLDFVKVKQSSLGKDGSAIGAATLIIEHILKFDKFNLTRDMLYGGDVD